MASHQVEYHDQLFDISHPVASEVGLDGEKSLVVAVRSGQVSYCVLSNPHSIKAPYKSQRFTNPQEAVAAYNAL